MVQISESIEREIESFLLPLTRAGRKPITIREYRAILVRTFVFLEQSGHHIATAADIGHDEVDVLLERFWINAPKYNHNRRTTFFAFCRYFGNDIERDYPSPRNSSMRVRVDWLSDSEAVALYNACETPLEQMVVHLELKLGLRRVDAWSIKMDSILISPEDSRVGYFDVIGKFDKPRTVSFCSDTYDVLNDWLHVRDEIVGDLEDPGNLIVYRRGIYQASIHPYGKTAWDNIVHTVAEKAGIGRSISNHTLRRTCARMWFRSGASIEQISILLGHASVETTFAYLGLALADLNDGQSKFDRWWDMQVENFSVSGKVQEEKVDRARFELAASTMPR